jgi:hypothetical protein
MGEPSELPSAAVVADLCYQRYLDVVGDDLDEGLRWDLEGLAETFAQRGTLEPIFIDRLVPWDTFVRPYNAGHAAIADLLLCKAAASAISTNYDILIERFAWDQRTDFESALDGNEATRCTKHGPLLKPHGCAHRERRRTVWTLSQLAAGPMADRIENSKIWMRANLAEKDLLIVGFWSDWRYLNEIIENALEGAAPASITLVDPGEGEALAEKAPGLWEIAHAEGTTFRHVSEDGASFLNDLRIAYSRSWIRHMLRSARASYQAETGEEPSAELLAQDAVLRRPG